MITASIDGLGEVKSSVLSLASMIEPRKHLSDVSESFAARLRAATPVGYSGKLRDSVIYSVDDTQATVGYEQGVETAGRESLDSVRSVRTRGRSVIQRKKWVTPGELEAVLQETFDSYSDEAVALLEESMASGIS